MTSMWKAGRLKILVGCGTSGVEFTVEVVGIDPRATQVHWLDESIPLTASAVTLTTDFRSYEAAISKGPIAITLLGNLGEVVQSGTVAPGVCRATGQVMNADREIVRYDANQIEPMLWTRIECHGDGRIIVGVP